MTDWMKEAAALLPQRRNDSNKYTYGHLLLVAGSENYAGAGILSLKAAGRSGVGLITVALPETVASLMRLTAPYAISMSVTRAAWLDAESVDHIAAMIPGKTAFAVGPGLTREADVSLIELLLDSEIPGVLDADALNIISMHPELRTKLSSRHILTPHLGELYRLNGNTKGESEELVLNLSDELNCTVLLKGSITYLASAGQLYSAAPGTAGMACGGSGDVLTGLIGGFLAQGMSTWDAAKAGFLIHGLAGQIAAEKYGSIAMNAGDITEQIGEAMHRIASCDSAVLG